MWFVLLNVDCFVECGLVLLNVDCFVECEFSFVECGLFC